MEPSNLPRNTISGQIQRIVQQFLVSEVDQTQDGAGNEITILKFSSPIVIPIVCGIIDASQS